MTDPKKHDILYQYFWVKVVSKDEVLRRRAAGLQDGPVDNIPLNNPVVIPWLRMISTLSDAKLVVDVLPRNDMKEVKDKDIQVDIPPNNKEAIAEFRVLSTPDWPYLRLLRTLADNTQFEEAKDPTAALKNDGGLVAQVKEKIVRKINSKAKFRADTLLNDGRQAEREDPIPLKFESMVAFGVPPTPPPPVEGQAPPPPPQPPRLGK